MRARRPLWQRRLPVLAAAGVFAVGNLAVFLSYRSSSHARREALEARRVELARAVGEREAEATRLARQQERLSGVSEAITEFYGKRIGTQRETLASVVAEVHAVLKDAGVAAPQISYATTLDHNLPLAQMRITFPVRCDYARFKHLLKAFESSKHWIAVRSVTIQRDVDVAGSVQVQLELTTYFDERDSAPERPAARARGAVPARKAGR
jgi:Tfp pilus assembly protein PilO